MEKFDGASVKLLLFPAPLQYFANVSGVKSYDHTVYLFYKINVFTLLEKILASILAPLTTINYSTKQYFLSNRFSQIQRNYFR